MSFIIGFKPNAEKKANSNIPLTENAVRKTEPKKSLVRVYFEDRDFSCTYYNDKFDLKVGDIVFVEGKMENLKGRVTEVSYGFKIKLSDYKRVIALADTEVHGKLYMTRRHFISFERKTLPYSKVSTWYAPPLKEDDVIVSGDDDATYPLSENMTELKATPSVYNRGVDYYLDGNVKYIELNGENGRAIVEGNRGYTVEFQYKNGEVSKLRCDCYCIGICKHIVATLLQFKEILESVEENYADIYKESGYFSVINKATLLSTVTMQKEQGEITL
ncbi:MAG: hypothetical protein IJO20_08130 [Ruminococcus sp.]|nr:hypothetical protein [Ruminococcus sp.]